MLKRQPLKILQPLPVRRTSASDRQRQLFQSKLIFIFLFYFFLNSLAEALFKKGKEDLYLSTSHTANN